MKNVSFVLTVLFVFLFANSFAQLAPNNSDIMWYKDQKPFKEGYIQGNPSVNAVFSD